MAVAIGLAMTTLIVLPLSFRDQTKNHHIELESCARPVLELLAIMWSVAIVCHVCQQFDIDAVKAFSGEDRSNHVRLSDITFDLYIFATGCSFFYLLGLVLVQLFEDSTGLSEWKVFSEVSFLSVMTLVLFNCSCLPLQHPRRCLRQALGRTVCAGFSSVDFIDVFVGDYLTSVSKGLGDIFICPCAWATAQIGLALPNDAQWWCITSMLTPMAASMPFVWRLLQCIKCFCSTGDTKHTLNAVKYTLGIIVVFFSTLKRRGLPEISAVYYGFVGINSLYSFVWDVFVDWNLLGYDSSGKRFVMREGVFSPFLYVVAISLDFVLRISWSMKLVSTRMSGERAVLVAIALELFRRTMWAVIRIEREALAVEARADASGAKKSSGGSSSRHLEGGQTEEDGWERSPAPFSSLLAMSDKSKGTGAGLSGMRVTAIPNTPTPVMLDSHPATHLDSLPAP